MIFPQKNHEKIEKKDNSTDGKCAFSGDDTSCIVGDAAECCVFKKGFSVRWGTGIYGCVQRGMR